MKKPDILDDKYQSNGTILIWRFIEDQDEFINKLMISIKELYDQNSVLMKRIEFSNRKLNMLNESDKKLYYYYSEKMIKAEHFLNNNKKQSNEKND